jgi:hypothetical protein
MRLILIIAAACCLLPAACFSQTYPRDSTWNAQESGNWYVYKQTQLSAIEFDLTKRLIGPDSVLAKTYTDAARNRSATMANDARAVRRFRDDITETIRQRDATRTQIGLDFLRPLQDEAAPSLTGGTWELKTDSIRAIAFSVTAQGVLRYTLSGYTPRQAVVLGDVMRLLRFEGTQEYIDLYRDGARWRTLSGAVVLRAQGRTNLQRSSLAPPENVVSAPSMMEATVIVNPMVMTEKPPAAKAKSKTTTRKKAKPSKQ